MLTTRSIRYIIRRATLLVVALVGFGREGNAQNGRMAAAPATSMDTTPVPIVLYQEDVVAFIDQPTEHLIAARSALARQDRATAARELGAAAANMRVQAGYAAGTDRSDVLEAARDVDNVSAKVRASQIHTTRQLDDALGRANRALALHHLERARQAWGRRETEKAGRELRAAADATERAGSVVGQDTKAGATDVVRGARLVCGKLIEGAGWTADEVGKAFADLGRAVDRLGKKVEPHGR